MLLLNCNIVGTITSGVLTLALIGLIAYGLYLIHKD